MVAQQHALSPGHHWVHAVSHAMKPSPKRKRTPAKKTITNHGSSNNEGDMALASDDTADPLDITVAGSIGRGQTGKDPRYVYSYMFISLS